MPSLDPVQQAVLDRWGMTLPTSFSDDPAGALAASRL